MENNVTREKRRPRKYGSISIAFVLLTFAGIFIYGWITGDIAEAMNALGGVSLGYLGAALGCLALFVLLRAMCVVYFVRQNNRSLSLFAAIRVTLVGLYYSGITPASTGGQPMQIYELSRNSVAPAIGTSAMLVETFGFQLAQLLIGAAMLLTHWSYMNVLDAPMRWMLLTGYAVNVFFSVILTIMLLKSRLVVTWVQGLIRFGGKLKLIRNPDATMRKIIHHVEDYSATTKLLLKNPRLMIGAAVLALAQTAAYFSILYFIVLGFGITGYSYGLILTMQTQLHLCTSLIPTPGASGAQEGGFVLFFRNIIPDGLMLPVILSWRFIQYYLTLILGAGFILADAWTRRRIRG
ncbi:MAG: flippase-like domain-containing protein [Oscillospiraceae bacterium]|jgi:uncharacterized protein (TIRG00374 family)|nr:flippase-like domain-containing protein [Oscillospiraceae bacterium]